MIEERSNNFPDGIKEIINKIKKIHFIKLGEKGVLEKTLLEEGEIAISFRQVDIMSDSYDTIQQKYQAEGSKTKSVATTFANQIEKFRTVDEEVLWVTFSQQKLWWGISGHSGLFKSPKLPADYSHYTNRKLEHGWYDCDINGKVLTYENIAGVLLAVKGYQGTICDISKTHNFDTADYLIRKLKGEKIEALKTADDLKEKFESALIAVIKLLQPKDFEYFVDLVFMRSGWVKQTAGGGVEKDIDLDLVQPLTGERVFVQIKSSTNKNEFDDYLAIYREHKNYNKFIFVYHSSEKEIFCEEDDVIIMDNKALAKLSIELGLSNFLLKKVS